VIVPTLRSLTLEQWVEHYRALKAKNEAPLQVKINSKDFRPRRAERMAGNSGAERPSAPNLVKRVAGKSVARRVPRKREETSKPETYLRLHHVPVFVRNQDLSLRFYLDQLGFRLIMDYNYGERGRFVLVAPPNGATLLRSSLPNPTLRNIRSSAVQGRRCLLPKMLLLNSTPGVSAACAFIILRRRELGAESSLPSKM